MKAFEAYWLKMPTVINYCAAESVNQVKTYVASALQEVNYTSYNPYIEIRVKRRFDLDSWASQFTSLFNHIPEYVCCPISDAELEFPEIINLKNKIPDLDIGKSMKQVNSDSFDIDPDVVLKYLSSNGWSIKELKDNVVLLCYEPKQIKILFPVSREYGDYENRLLEIFLAIQHIHSPNIQDVANWVKDAAANQVSMIQPYYTDEYITLYNADCREVLPALIGEYFGWTDPPYNVGKDYGVWCDRLDDDQYLNFCSDWLTQFKYLCPENCVFAPRKYFLEYWNMLGKQYRQIVLTWTPEGRRAGFVNQHASLLTNAKPKRRTKDVWHNLQTPGLGWFFREQTYGHPGYTSEDLTNHVLAHLACPTLPILDSFAGTGTTLKCAKDMNRMAVGIEINEKYCEIAARRLSQQVLPIWNQQLEKQVIL